MSLFDAAAVAVAGYEKIIIKKLEKFMVINFNVMQRFPSAVNFIVLMYWLAARPFF